MPNTTTNPYVLSTWDQAASRTMVRLALCFPVEGSPSPSATDIITDHLRKSLDRLASTHPHYSARLFLGPHQGRVYMHESSEYEIPFTQSDESGSFGMTYDEYTQAGFPAFPMVHPRWTLDGDVRDTWAIHGYDMSSEEQESAQSAMESTPEQEEEEEEGEKKKRGTPVITIRAFYITGGLVLGVFFNHAFGDGDAMSLFVKRFAEQSCLPTPCQPRESNHRDLAFTGYLSHASKTPDVTSLFAKCPEYTYLPRLLGPNNSIEHPGGRPVSSYPKTGRTFQFDIAKLAILRGQVRSSLGLADDERPGFPTNYVLLATLTWSHVVAARRIGEKGIPAPDDYNDDGHNAMMMNPVNWSYHCFLDTNPGYFGSAVMLAKTDVSIPTILSATNDMSTFATLTEKVSQNLRLDEEFVKTRLQLVAEIDDPRNLMLDFDGRVKEHLVFNTWRKFGADTQWSLTPSAPLIKPDALRRPQPEWNLCGSLILPAKDGADVLEVVITIPERSMAVLEKDEGYIQHCRRVVG